MPAFGLLIQSFWLRRRCCWASPAVIWYTLSRRPPLLTEQDSIVLADFENRTGEAAFDGTLKNVLEVEISQSPYLNILPDQDVRQTLEYMRRRPDDPITKQVGLEICQRNSAKAMVNGSIASLGNRYVLTLEALNCTTGGVLAAATSEADSKERVLRALDDSTAEDSPEAGRVSGFDPEVRRTHRAGHYWIARGSEDVRNGR